METRWERLAPLSGVLAFVLTAVGLVLTSDSPDFLAEPREIADYYADDSGKVIGAAYIGLLGTVAYIVFVGVLRNRLRRAEGPEGRLSAIAFAGGVAAAAPLLMIDIFNLAGGLRADEDGRIDPGTAASLFDLSGLSLVAAAMAVSVLVFATAALALRTGVLPRWLGWISVLVGIGLLTPVSYIFLALFLVWMLVVAVLLYLSPAAPVTAAPPPVGRVPG
jgi:hypothetical protein